MPGSTFMVDVAFTYANAKYRCRLVKSGDTWTMAATLNGNPIRTGTSFPVSGTKVTFFPGSPGKNGRLQIEAGESCCVRHRVAGSREGAWGAAGRLAAFCRLGVKGRVSFGRNGCVQIGARGVAKQLPWRSSRQIEAESGSLLAWQPA